MTDIPPSLREHLEQFRDFMVAHGHAPERLHYAGDLDLVLREGREFRSVPWKTWRGRGYRRARVRECFKNAHLLADRFPDLVYCEGFATKGFLPIHHAWCADADGRVVDPTWREDHGDVTAWEYLGVPFDLAFVDEVSSRKGTYGVLDDYSIYESPLPDGAVWKEEVWASS